MDEIIKFTEEKDEEHWISVSDLMAGLMIIFLFIAIVLINDITKDDDAERINAEFIKIKRQVVLIKEIEDNLYNSLLEEFEDDLEKWNAKLDRDDLAFRFNEPDVFFESQEVTLKEEFKDILKDFFPRYLKVLKKFKDDIAEVRIEGHTSSKWKEAKTKDEAYINNMELSQGRTREVLRFNLSLPNIRKNKEWAKKLLTANGLSSSQSKKKADGSEDEKLSRRVEFEIRTKIKERVLKIIESAE